MLRIKDFNIPTDRNLVGSEGHPVQTAKLLLQRPPKSLFGLNPEKLSSGSVYKLDLAV